MKSFNMPFRVEVWSKDGQSREETLCACTSFSIAKAAFEQAVSSQPNARIMLRDRARVIRDYRPECLSKPL